MHLGMPYCCLVCPRSVACGLVIRMRLAALQQAGDAGDEWCCEGSLHAWAVGAHLTSRHVHGFGVAP